MKPQFGWKSAALDGLSIVLALAWLAPILWMVSTAFKPNPEIFQLPLRWIPESPTLQQFTSSLKVAPFEVYYRNSAFVGGGSTLLILVIASMAGYAFARLPFPGRALALGGLLSSTMIPFQVLLIPFFILMTTLKLVNTPYGLVLAYAAMFLPFSVFMFRAYFLTLPREIEESARIDGCSWFGVYWRIAMPLARPIIAAVGIYTFVEVWNEFFVALVLTNREAARTLPVGLAMLKNDVNGISWGQVMASSTMAAVPAILVFLILQKQIIAGLSGGAVKG